MASLRTEAAPPQVSEQAERLHHAVSTLLKKYQFRDRNDICCHGISVSQCYTLEALWEQGPLNMQPLADQLHLAISTVTRVVDQLVAKGFVERHHASHDRRVCQIHLTEAGATLIGAIRHDLLAREQAILQRLPAESRDHVIWAIDQLTQVVDDWRATVPKD